MLTQHLAAPENHSSEFFLNLHSFKNILALFADTVHIKSDPGLSSSSKTHFSLKSVVQPHLIFSCFFPRAFCPLESLLF